MKKDDYIAGPHSFWTHFIFGLFFGAVVGFCWAGRMNLRTVHGVVEMTAGTALVVAFCCGRWGDGTWEKMLSIFCWWK